MGLFANSGLFCGILGVLLGHIMKFGGHQRAVCPKQTKHTLRLPSFGQLDGFSGLFWARNGCFCSKNVQICEGTSRLAAGALSHHWLVFSSKLGLSKAACGGKQDGGAHLRRTKAWGGLHTPPPSFSLAKFLGKSKVFIYPKPPFFLVKGLLSPPHTATPVGEKLPLVLRIWTY